MTQVIAASLTLDPSQANTSVKSFKQQLREANNELITIQQKFGETSKEALAAAKSVAGLKAQIKDAKEVSDLFNPETKFQALGNAVRATVGGITALTGAMALFGSESKEVQEALLKVQGALALTQGLNTILDSAKDFGRLKAVVVDAFKAIKTAIGSTGIGLFVIAAGAIYEYWDDIKELVTGTNSELSKNAETSKKIAETEKEKLGHIDDQDNLLKSQGKTEKQILELKEKQVQEVIKAEEAQLSAQKLVQKEQIETAQRNHDILKGVLEFISQPIKIILSAVDTVRNAFGAHSNLVGALDKGLDSAANLLFDPAATKKKADATNKETEEGITKLKNQYAGYQNQIKEINKQALAKEKAFQAELKGLRDAANNALITDADILAQKKLKQEYENQQASIKQEVHTKAQRNELLKALQEKYENESAALTIAKLKEVNDKLLEAQVEADKKKRDADALQFQNFKNSGKQNIQNILDVQNEIGSAQLDAAGQQAEQQMNILNKQLGERLAAVKGNAQAEADILADYERQKTEITNIENMQRLAIISGVLGQAADLFGKATVAGKVLAIAQTTIDTYQSASLAYKAMVGIPFIGPTVAPIAAGIAIATGLANIKKIISVQVPGASGGSGIPSVSASAPLIPTPQVSNTQLPQGQINQLGSAATPVKAFVVESDITNSQSRVTRLNRQARLGG
jgi:hypothetical protein